MRTFHIFTINKKILKTELEDWTIQETFAVKKQQINASSPGLRDCLNVKIASAKHPISQSKAPQITFSVQNIFAPFGCFLLSSFPLKYVWKSHAFETFAHYEQSYVIDIIIISNSRPNIQKRGKHTRLPLWIQMLFLKGRILQQYWPLRQNTMKEGGSSCC